MRLASAGAVLLGLASFANAAGRDMQAVGMFMIDRTEVTVGQFRPFVAATGTKTKAEADGGGSQYRAGWEKMPGWIWSHPYGTPAMDNEPAVHVTWHEAKAYCAWAGLRLPTDAEWLEAAYTERRADPPAPFVAGRTYPYPTGDAADGANQRSNTRAIAGLPKSRPELSGGPGHAPAGAAANGVNGLFDMGGNVWEWVDHDVGGLKRTRGGSWWYGPAQMKADALYEKAADFPAVYIGFRCARDR